MGDVVEQILERQIPALRDLVDRRLMTSEEVKGIVEQRRQFEYRLQRRASRKVDFMRYIEFEFKVDSLRRLRKKRLSLKKKTISDFAQISHIFFIFERAVRKFQGDPEMWQQLIDFAIQQNAEKRLSTLFPRALQMHPRNAALWIRAASYQYFNLSNATTARILLQRALRMNPKEKLLWIEYFRLEMHYVAKVHGRRGVLGLNNEEEEASSSRFAVPLTLFKTAIRQHKSDFNFRCEFIKVSEEFEDSFYLEALIVASMRKDFAELPNAWIYMARRVLNSGDASISLLEEGVELNPQDSLMWEAYSDFLSECQHRSGEDRYSLMNNDVCSRAHSVSGDLSVAMYVKWSRLAVSGSGPTRECDILRKAIVSHKTSPELWVALLSASKWGSSQSEMVGLLEEALKTIGDISQGTLCTLYQPVLETLIEQGGDNFDTCNDFFMGALKRSATPPSLICSQYLSWTFSAKGLEGARTAYATIRHMYRGEGVQLGSISMDFIRLLRACNDVDVAAVREIFECSTSFSGASGEMFEAYIAFEESLHNLDRASAIRWRMNSTA